MIPILHIEDAPCVDEGGPLTITSHTIESVGSGAGLTLMEASWRQGIWSAFANWLDDHMGDHMDRISAVLENRTDWSVIGSQMRQFH